MNAKIKKEKMAHLKNLGFKETEEYHVREIKHPVLLVVEKKTRRLVVWSPFGEAAFMESHKDKFQDLLDVDMVEFTKGKYD